MEVVRVHREQIRGKRLALQAASEVDERVGVAHVLIPSDGQSGRAAAGQRDEVDGERTHRSIAQREVARDGQQIPSRPGGAGPIKHLQVKRTATEECRIARTERADAVTGRQRSAHGEGADLAAASKRSAAVHGHCAACIGAIDHQATTLNRRGAVESV